MVTQNESRLSGRVSLGILTLVLLLMGLTLERSYNAVGRALAAEEAADDVSNLLAVHMARQEEREKSMVETLGRIEASVKAIHNGNK